MLSKLSKNQNHRARSMLRDKFNRYYVVKENSTTLVWEIEKATFEQAEIVYKADVDRAKLAANPMI